MKKIASVLLGLLFSIFIMGCEVGINKQFDDQYNGKLLENISNVSSAEIYKNVGEESKFGFIYGDYVYKKEVYLGPFFSRSIFPSDEYADGYAYHIVDSPLIQYQKIDFDLKQYFDEDYTFKYNNQFDYKSIEYVVYMKEYKSILSSESVEYKENLLFIAKDKTLYLSFGTFNLEENKFVISIIHEMEYLPYVSIVSKINNYQNKVISYKIQGMKYDDFLKKLNSIENANYTSFDTFIKTVSLDSFEKYCVFSTSGMFGKVYMLIDKFVFIVNSDYNKISLELYALKDGVVIETSKDPKKFRKLLYKYAPELLDDNQIVDIDEYEKDTVNFYSFKSLKDVDSITLTYHRRLIDSVIHMKQLENEEEKEEFKKIIKSLIFVREDYPTNPYVYDNIYTYSKVYSISYGDLSLVFNYESNTIVIDKLGQFKIVNNTNELLEFIQTKLFVKNE